MSTATKIEWTRGDDGSAGATWNPVTGCTRVSAGCDHCYAATLARRLKAMGNPRYQLDGPDGPGFGVTLHPDKLTEPQSWRKPRRVFVNSMSDLFHDEVPDEFIAAVFAVMARTPRHTFQVLTKRPGRMASFVARWMRWRVPGSKGRGLDEPVKIRIISTAEECEVAADRIACVLTARLCQPAL